MAKPSNGVLPGTKTAMVMPTPGVRVAAARFLLVLEEVVFAIAYRLRREELVDAVACLTDPGADSVEHIALDLNLLVPDSWMMESTENIVDHLVNRHSRILPGVEDTAIDTG